MAFKKRGFRRRISKKHSRRLFRATHHIRQAIKHLSRGGRRL